MFVPARSFFFCLVGANAFNPSGKAKLVFQFHRKSMLGEKKSLSERKAGCSQNVRLVCDERHMLKDNIRLLTRLAGQP